MAELRLDVKADATALDGLKWSVRDLQQDFKTLQGAITSSGDEHLRQLAAAAKKQLGEVSSASRQLRNSVKQDSADISQAFGSIAPNLDKLVAAMDRSATAMERLAARRGAASQRIIRANQEEAASAQKASANEVAAAKATEAAELEALRAALAAAQASNKRSSLRSSAGGRASDPAQEVERFGERAHAVTRGVAAGFDNMWLSYGKYALYTAGAYAAIAGLRSAMSKGLELDDRSRFISALDQDSKSPLGSAKISDSLVQASKEIGVASATDLAGTLRALVQAGLPASDSLRLLGTTAKYATIEQVDAKQAGEELIGTLNNFGLVSKDNAALTEHNFKRTGDVVAYVANSTTAGLSDVNTSFKNMIGVSSAFNVTLEEAAVLVQRLGAANIKSGAAGTIARNFLDDLLGKNSKAGATIRQKLGMEAFDPTKENWITYIDKLLAKLRELDGKQRIDVVGKLTDERGRKLANELLASTETLAQNLEKVRAGSTGALGNFWEKYTDGNAAVEVQKTQKAFDTLLATIGKDAAPVVSGLAQALREIFENKETLETLKLLVPEVAGLAAAGAKATIAIGDLGVKLATAPDAQAWFKFLGNLLGLLDRLGNAKLPGWMSGEGLSTSGAETAGSNFAGLTRNVAHRALGGALWDPIADQINGMEAKKVKARQDYARAQDDPQNKAVVAEFLKQGRKSAGLPEPAAFQFGYTKDVESPFKAPKVETFGDDTRSDRPRLGDGQHNAALDTVKRDRNAETAGRTALQSLIESIQAKTKAGTYEVDLEEQLAQYKRSKGLLQGDDEYADLMERLAGKRLDLAKTEQRSINEALAAFSGKSAENARYAGTKAGQEDIKARRQKAADAVTVQSEKIGHDKQLRTGKDAIDREAYPLQFGRELDKLKLNSARSLEEKREEYRLGLLDTGDQEAWKAGKSARSPYDSKIAEAKASLAQEKFGSSKYGDLNKYISQLNDAADAAERGAAAEERRQRALSRTAEKGAIQFFRQLREESENAAAWTQKGLNVALSHTTSALEELATTGHTNFHSFVSGMLQDLARLAAQKAAMQLISSISGATSGSAGWVGALVSAFSTKHTGGIAGGEYTGSKSVSPSVFLGAPRMHTGGIAAGEVPTILKAGEGVFTEGQMRKLSPVGAGGGSITIAPAISVTVTGGADRQQSQQQGAIVSKAVEQHVRAVVLQTLKDQKRTRGVLAGA